MRKTSVIWLCGLLSLVLGGCTTPAVRQAEAVVAQADSLWQAGKMYGIDEGDSASLAQACETLSTFNSPLLSTFNYQLSTDFSRLCYHYGRLLREKDNPVAAMQVFIDATHSRTRDYHILGRVYSNIGDLCHLAGDFPLSYDMFSRSADCFLRNGDTLLYYYDLNNMAFELANLADSSACLLILRQIERIPELSALSMMTKSEMYLKCHQYDSAICFANQLCILDENNTTGLLIKAQSFSFLKEQDSAALYADLVLRHSSLLSDKQNALYILTNDDSRKNIESIRQIAAERSDIQQLLKIRQGKLSQAVQLLEQDLQSKPDWRKWVILFFVVLLCFTAFCVPYILRRHEQQMKEQVTILSDKQATNIIDSIKKHIDTTDINSTLHWKNYKEMKTDVDLYMGGLVSKLETHHLNEVEIRFCILTLLDFRLKRIAETLNYSYPSGIKTLKKRTSDKLKTTPLELKNYLLHKL